MVLNQDFKEFIQSLNDNQVHYLVVGKYAATLHGYPRQPKNLDIWIEASPQNAHQMVLALIKVSLEALGFSEEDFKSEDQIITLSFSPTRRVVINTINEIEFGVCFEARVQKQLGEISVDVVPLEHLRINKSNLWTVTGLGRT